MLEAMLKEIETRVNYLEGERVSTLYFGGGTPSLLSVKEINDLISCCEKHFELVADIEITLEANPDDLNDSYLNDLDGLTFVNRLSVGIQSFHDEELKFMNRAHSAREALECLERIKSCSFNSISTDLIFGVPGSSDYSWKKNLSYLMQFDPEHISLYALTVEDKTPLAKQIRLGKATGPEESVQHSQFLIALDYLVEYGYEQYEISNYAKTGYESKHNSSYWKSKKYLGIGPSAHSYNGLSRSWNVANNKRYLDGIKNGEKIYYEETLKYSDRYNEYVMTSIRTKWGISADKINKDFSDFESSFLTEVKAWIETGHIQYENNNYILTREGKFLADGIAASLFVG